VVADIQLTGTLLSSVLAEAQAGDPGSEARNVTILTPLRLMKMSISCAST